MAQKTYIVDGRQFRTEYDYKDAMYDKELIDKLRKSSEGYNLVQLKKLADKVGNGEFHFRTLLGQDFEDELRGRIKKMERGSQTPRSAESNKTQPVKSSEKMAAGKKKKETLARTPEQEKALEKAVMEELAKREKFRQRFLTVSGLLAIVFLGIFGIYAYQQKRTELQNQKLGQLVGYEAVGSQQTQHGNEAEKPYKVQLDGEKEVPEVLDEYKTVFNQHKKLIGWLKFDDKDIGGQYGFPVMQTGDNEFFLSHDIEMNSDKNGTIFMDTNCDVLAPSTNYILYGHHMKSGAMFGNLDHYAKESYWQKYPYIEFDTIYEKGTYQVMYVFRSHVYSEEEIAFKYYQFVDAYSSQEFDSYMAEMAQISLYDTGVTASFGDHLLTLSTCDYQETNGRFVVVAKKVADRQ